MGKIRRHRNDPALHKRGPVTVVGVDGANLHLSLCRVGGWNMTDSWARVTCKLCLRRRAKKGTKP